MKYLTVKQTAEKWSIPERTIHNYCSIGKIDGAYLSGKTWFIPENAKNPQAKKPVGQKPFPLLERLREEKASGMSGGIYHKVQIELTYNSNHIEGSKLTHDQTRYIFETNTIGADSSLNVDDIV